MASLLNMSGGSLLKKGLPYDAEIEYLESTGTQIMYGTRKLSTIDYIEYSFDNVRQQNNSFVGVNGVAQIGVYDIRYNTDSIGFYKLVGTKETNKVWTIYNITKDTFYKNDFGGGSNTVNGLFSLEYGKFKAFIRLYEYLSKSEGIITEHFIPVRVGQVGYMYDKVSGQLFGNQGTGDFLLGPDK